MFISKREFPSRFPELVDGGVAATADQPGGGIVRETIPVPGPNGPERRFLKTILSEINVHQGNDPRFRTQETLDLQSTVDNIRDLVARESYEQAAELGALMYVGQPEYDAGLAAGQRAKRDGVGSFLCVNHYISSPSSTQRCQGFADGLGVDLGSQMIDSGQDPSEIKNKVLAYLSANKNTDAVLTLGPTSADPTIAALQENGMAGDLYFGTFDLGTEIVKGIKAGIINWGIDQQPFLQAYLPVIVLTNYDRYGVLPGNNINSGPGFVTKDGLTLVEKYAGEYR